MPSSVNASGDAPGDGFALTVTAPETKAESGVVLPLGADVAKAATTKRSVPMGAVTVKLHVSPPPLATAHGLGVVTGKIWMLVVGSGEGIVEGYGMTTT